MGGRYGGNIRGKPPAPARGRGWWLRPRDDQPGDRWLLKAKPKPR